MSVSLMLPGTAFAVTLGDMVVDSYLNQPLSASISLSRLGEVPLSGIKVKLASPEAFKRVGIARPYSLSKLKFKLANKAGKPAIFITSHERIEEPYIQLLIDVTWAKGQYYRSYTLLLDPPNYAGHQIGKKKAANYRVKARKVTIPYLQKQPVLIDKTIVSKKALKKYGPVKSHDDLWQIAKRYKKDGVTPQQIMLGIIAYNPTAFSQGNINGLKKGVMLTIPPLKDVETIPADKAKLEVLAQIDAWRDKKPIKHVIKPPYLLVNKKPAVDKPVASFLPPLNFEKSLDKKPEIKPQEKIPVSVDASSNKAVIETPPKPASGPIKAAPKPKLAKKVSVQGPKAALFDGDLVQVPTILTQIVKSSEDDSVSNALPEKEAEMSKTTIKTQPAISDTKESSKDALANKEIAVAISAIASVKESNQLLRDQVKALTKQNEMLRIQSLTTEKELKQLKRELRRLSSLINQSKANTVEDDDTGLYDVALTLFGLILFITAAGGILFYLNQQGMIEIAFLKRFLGQEEAESDGDMEDEEEGDSEDESVDDGTELAHNAVSSHELSPKTENIESSVQATVTRTSDAVIDEQAEEAAIDTSTSEPEIVGLIKEDAEHEKESQSAPKDIVKHIEADEVAEEPNSLEQKAVDTAPQELDELEFEEGLSPSYKELKESHTKHHADSSDTESQPDEVKEESEKGPMELVHHDDDKHNRDSKGDENEKQTKAVSVQTQLALAETYISMDDKDSAIEALEEVMAHGDDDAKAKASELLAKLKG